MAHKIEGNWKKGIAFDNHTLSSTYLGVDQFGHKQWDNQRSEMGELVYQLKYLKDSSVVHRIVELLDRIKGVEEMDLIIPIPPTDATRAFQPVTLIAQSLGKRRNVEVAVDLLLKRPGGDQLKNVDDPDEREKLLRDSLALSETHNVAGKKVLLVDDLYRSGATLSVATELLIEQGGVTSVSVLAMTKTRSRR